VYAFTTWLSTLVVLFPLTLTLMVVAVTAIVLPYRRRELFEASPVNQRWFGIPALSIAGVAALLGFAAVTAILLIDEASGTSIAEDWKIVVIALGVFLVPGPLIYYVARWVRARKGIDLDLVYTEIPPE
jgi:APA family basic amino acid/polyamine antiporter